MKKVTAFFLCIILLIPMLASCFRTTEGDPLFSDNTEDVTDSNETEQADSTLATESQNLPETEPPVTKTASFLGAGDNIIYYGNVRDAASLAVSGGRKYNFSPSYARISDIVKAADVAFINQETLMCGEGWEFSYYPTFNGPQDAGYDLVDVGFDVVNIATNHMLDKGGAGLEATINFWNKMPVTMVGGYLNEEDYNNIRVHEVNDIKIAFLSYTYGTNGISLGSGFDIKIPYLYKYGSGGEIVYEADIEAQVAEAKKISDFVFISVHWGEENQFQPNDKQKHYAQVMADAGADAIIGHHPHVIQPIEWLTGKDGSRTLCVYSLGNFMAEMAADYNMVGGMITFDITVTGDDKQISNVLFIPTVFHFPSNFYNNIIYLMEEYTEELASKHGVRTYYQNPCTLARMKKYVKDTISSEFLPDYLK